jgi:hypothetical protein
MTLTRNERIVIGGLIVVAAAFAWGGVRASPGGGIRQPARASEDVNFWYSPLQPPVVGPNQLIGGYAYHPHRYPKLCGGEITTLLHRGFSTASIPAEDDMEWLTKPPSEVAL